jgi:hypothetical protein
MPKGMELGIEIQEICCMVFRNLAKAEGCPESFAEGLSPRQWMGIDFRL